MNIKRSILLRVRVAFLLAFLFSVAIVVKIGRLQFTEGEKWKKMANETSIQYLTVAATRGNIYSDNGSLLATSLPFYKLAFDPSMAHDTIYNNELDNLCILLSDHFGDRSPREYKDRILEKKRKGREYMVLNSRQINHHEKKEMITWPMFRHGKMNGGVIFETVDKRYKPFTGLGARTIGRLNQKTGRVGLEFSYNEQLSGKNGKTKFQKMSGGSWKPLHDASEIQPVKGLDIESTLDINLQDIANDALLKALLDLEAAYGAVVVMEVATGEIKAMVNLTRNKENGTYGEVYNYAVQGLTEPGSTFKLASMIALLEDSERRLSDTVDTGNGKYAYFDRTMPDHKIGGFGKITLEETFALSSNIGVSKLVYKQFGLNPQRFIDYISDFGLDKPLGFQMIGEGIPYIKNTKDPSWSGVSLPWMSIGHELTLTPLQTLTFYNAVANNGKMIRPIIVKSVKKSDRIKESYSSYVLNDKICSDKTLRKVHKMLEAVVQYGTAKNVNNAHYKIAGKTGTAQKLVDGRYSKSKYYTSFAGYFPADRPKYSCIVVIDEPKGYRQYGSDVSAPVFKEIADKIYARDIELHEALAEGWNVEPGTFPVIKAGYQEDLAKICNAIGISNHSDNEEQWVRAQRSGNSVKWRANGMDISKVPDVTGLTLKDALYILENRGLRVKHRGIGRVIEQSQRPGKKALKGSRIVIQLG